jgi:lipoprotein-releasing system ATP-binding protein
MLEVRNLSKVYSTPGGKIPVLSGISLSLSDGDALSIMGPSGSGKSTLLYILGGLEQPTEGTVGLDGINPYLLDEKGAAEFRNEKIGFVFQDHHLLPQCTVLENVLVPTLVSRSGRAFGDRARDLIDQVGLSSRLHHLPQALSGGERQRVAVARALIMDPLMVLCDEPTGNLDADSTHAVASLLMEMHRNRKSILIVVTHNLEVAQKFELKYRLAHSSLDRI